MASAYVGFGIVYVSVMAAFAVICWAQARHEERQFDQGSEGCEE